MEERGSEVRGHLQKHWLPVEESGMSRLWGRKKQIPFGSMTSYSSSPRFWTIAFISPFTIF